MGVTTGQLTTTKKQLITITVPGSLNQDQATELSDALNAVIDEFNSQHQGGKPSVRVEQ